MTDVTIKVSLDDESKKLLKSAIAAAAKIGGAAASGGKSGKGKAAEDDDFDDGVGDDDGDGEDGDGDGEDGDGEDGDGDGEDGEDEVTIDNVGEALKAYATAPGSSKAEAMKLLKAKGKTDKLSALKKTLFQAVIDAAKAATVAKKKAAKAKK
jgi:hypothetical protein